MTAPATPFPPRPTVLQVDLDAAAANIRAVRELVGPTRKIFAVVKADAYGYGAAELGPTFLAHGADALAVGDLGEGIRLRKAGITAPILVYPNSLPEAARAVVDHRLTPAVVDLVSARAYAAAAAAPLDVFVQIDVGLERIGVPAEQAVELITAMLELPHLRIAGLSAHPHASHGGATDAAYAEWQLGRFTAVVDELANLGVRVPVRLLAASPFVLQFPETYLNAVDPGRMLYGITYDRESSPVTLRPTLHALVTRVIAVRDVVPRKEFAEFAPFPVNAPMRLGVIPIGSADGLSSLHAGRVLVRGRAVPIVVKPSLEVTLIDLTEVADACVGDDVVIIGRQGDAEITVVEVAARHHLDPQRVAITVGPRVVRMYHSTP